MIKYSIRKASNGKWRIDTAEKQGQARHHACLQNEFEKQDAAIIKIEQFSAQQ